MEKLSQIRPGDRMEIVDIPKRCPLRLPLQQFGITESSVLFCRYCSPGAELAALECNGTVVAVRLRDLTQITARRFP